MGNKNHLKNINDQNFAHFMRGYNKGGYDKGFYGMQMSLQLIQEIANFGDEWKSTNQTFQCHSSEPPDDQIYGILGVEGSVASNIVKHYITELVSRRKCDPMKDSKSFVFIWKNFKSEF